MKDYAHHLVLHLFEGCARILINMNIETLEVPAEWQASR